MRVVMCFTISKLDGNLFFARGHDFEMIIIDGCLSIEETPIANLKKILLIVFFCVC